MSVVNLPPQSDAKQKGGPSALNKLSATEISSAPDNVASPTKATTEKIKSVRSDDRVSDDHRPRRSSEKPYKSKDAQNSILKSQRHNQQRSALWRSKCQSVRDSNPRKQVNDQKSNSPSNRQRRNQRRAAVWRSKAKCTNEVVEEKSEKRNKENSERKTVIQTHNIAQMSSDNKDSPGFQQLVEIQLRSQKDISNLNSMIQSLATQITALQSMVSEATNQFNPNNQNMASTLKLKTLASEQPSSTRNDMAKTIDTVSTRETTKPVIVTISTRTTTKPAIDEKVLRGMTSVATSMTDDTSIDERVLRVKLAQGICVTQNIVSGELIIDQTEYVREVLTQFGVTDLTKHPEAPSPMKEALNIEDCPDVNNAKDTDKIQRTVARLLPLAKWTRPDIRAAVYELSKIKHNPGEKHMMAAYRLLCYLLRTQQYGSIVFSTHQSASDDVTKWRYGSIEFSHDMNQWWVQEERSESDQV